jgi:hypothetical protein
MLKLLMSFIGGNKVMLLALVLTSITTAAATWKVADWKHGKQLAEMENAAWQAHVESLNQKNEIDLYNQQVTSARAEAYELRTRKREVVTRYINRKVIEYVQNDNAGKCDMPDKWVQLHDDAAKNSDAGHSSAPRQPNDAPSRITDIEVLSTVTGNYQSCHQIRDQLIELQAWASNIKFETGR